MTLWRRNQENWHPKILEGLDATFDLPEIDAALKLSELYLDVSFEVP